MKKKDEKKTETRTTEKPATPPAKPIEMGDVIMLSVSALDPSETNPRKSFPAAAMRDLIASIQDKGIIQPLIVRTKPGGGPVTYRHEIVCGERRYRAAKELKLEKVPCIVCAMTDSQVVEVQVVENMQRADLSPLEEAQGYKQLRDQFKMDWPEIAARVGKSQQYVFRRLNLLNLIPDFLEMLESGELQVSWAEEILKVEDPEDQQKLFNKMEDQSAFEYWDLEGVQDTITSDFLLQLVNAPFPVKDKDLQGGACGSCAKRTGAQPDLFGDLTGKNDTCRDPKCWAAKKKEYEKKALSKYDDLIKAGHKVLVGAAAEKAMSSGQYSKATDTSYYLKSQTTWEKALKGTDYKPVIAIDSDGKKHELISPKAAIAFAPAKLRVAANAPEKEKTPEEKALAELESKAMDEAREEIEIRMETLAGKMDMNKREALQLILRAITYNATRGKDAKHLKIEIINQCYENNEEDTLAFFGLNKELVTLTKKKLAEMKVAAAKEIKKEVKK